MTESNIEDAESSPMISDSLSGRIRSHSYSPIPGLVRDWNNRRAFTVRQRQNRQYVVFSAEIFEGNTIIH